jgi:beta-lactamase regulating signal transducer with metallopeptidase domain
MSVWIAETLLATTLLMALALMLRRPVQRWLGAGASYLLWGLPLARMLLPALPREVASASPMQTALDQGAPVVQTLQFSVPIEIVPQIPWLEIAVALWGAGAVLFLLFHAIAYARFRALMLRGAEGVGEAGRIRIVASPRASGPLAFGVITPFVVVPVDFTSRFDADERDMAIAHECAHHARGDLIANMAALAVLALHWWNPIAWIAYRAYRADQELACDARVLRLQGQDMAHAYGRAILKAAGGRQVAAACHLNRVQSLKGRLKMLSNHAASLNRINIGMALVAAVTLAGLALTASGSRAAQQVAALTENVQQVDFSRLGDLMAQPAAANTGAPVSMPDLPPAPAESAPPPAAVSAMHAPVPLAPPAPLAPASDMIPPVPPVPPVVRSEDGRVTITHADGRVEIHRFPTQAEIRRMTPNVDVRNGCEDKAVTSHRETVDADGRKVVRIRICEAEIERSARAAERAAERAEQMAERQARLAELDGERAERQGKLAALNGLRAARVQISRQRAMPENARAEALRDLDQEIADMEAGRD